MDAYGQTISSVMVDSLRKDFRSGGLRALWRRLRRLNARKLKLLASALWVRLRSSFRRGSDGKGTRRRPEGGA
jgi:hypothetical protein